MRGSFGRWLTMATVAMLASVLVLGLTLVAGLARADALLDRAGRSQTQLALAYRLEASSMALLASDSLLRKQAVLALDPDLSRYRASIVTETDLLGAASQASQATETERAEMLYDLAARMRTETGPPLAADAERFRAIVRAIAVREEQEAAVAFEEMHRLRSRATLVAIALPLGLALVAGWLLVTMRRGLARPIARLQRAASLIGSGGADATGPGFIDFVPLGTAITEADREIVRQRAELANANRRLESQVVERTSALAQQNERLAAIDSTRRLFFSQVGHELRTPITVIRGEAEVVLRDASASAERLREGLRHIVVTGAFLGRRIDDLLAVARAEDGRLVINRAPIDFSQVVHAVEAIAKPYAASAGVALAIEATTGPLSVDGDASWLQQALLALIDNAVRYSSGGGSHIVLSVNAMGDMIVVTVADDGPGVSPELLPKLFDAWSQAEGVTGGSGLGMAVSSWVAEAHGGSISASNTPEGGFAVTIRLPRS